MLGQRNMAVVGQLLVPDAEDAIVMERREEFCAVGAGEGSREVEALNLGVQGTGESTDTEVGRHRRFAV